MQLPHKIKVLIAHSNALICAGLTHVLEHNSDFEPLACSPGLRDTSISWGRKPDVIVSDYESGLRLMASGSASGNRVIILADSDSEAQICHALERGARGYILLSGSLDELIESLKLVHFGGIAMGPTIVNRVADRIRQHALTRRECDVLGQMMLGSSNKAIARELTLAVGTVKTHVKSILEKLDAASRTQAVAIAMRRGLLRGESIVTLNAHDPPPKEQRGRVALRNGLHSDETIDSLRLP